MTRKNNTNKLTRCEATYCVAFQKRVARKTRKMVQKIMKKLGEKDTKRKIRPFRGFSKRMMKKLKATCKKAFCNPTCRGTLFEDGKTLPVALTKGKSKETVKLLQIMRKNIFQKKTSVLKD